MADIGITQEIRSSWRKGIGQMPVLSDLYTALLVEEHKAARDVAARLKEYAVGMYANAFNARTTINPRSPLVVFDVSHVRNEALKALRMRQIVTFIWSRMLRGDAPTLVVVDEAWHWLRHPQAAAELEEMARRFRKRYGGLQLGTQHIYDLESSGSAQVIRETGDIGALFWRQPVCRAPGIGGGYTGLRDRRGSERLPGKHLPYQPSSASRLLAASAGDQNQPFGSQVRA